MFEFILGFFDFVIYWRLSLGFALTALACLSRYSSPIHLRGELFAFHLDFSACF